MGDQIRKDRANAIRMLSVDAVQKANSGHPGMPMGMADIAEVLWHDFLQHNPQNPTWINRDRFILSNGHGSMLHYSLLHLTGYPLTIEDIKQFRQLHSKTPGHPEWELTPGIETTTGPLGQGLANAVGMAVARNHLAAEFNRPKFPIIDHYIYVFVGDGCLMEGISHEVCSLAGTLSLDKLIIFYDDNEISIDGKVKSWFSDNTPLRFAAYGFHVIPAVNGHDSGAISRAITEAHQVKDRPVLIVCKTTIGFGSPNLAGKAATHGAPLGVKEVAEVRQALHWSYAPFEIPQKIYETWDAREKGENQEKAWQALFAAYQKAYPELAQELLRRIAGQLPADFQNQSTELLQERYAKQENIATRKASKLCLDRYAKILPELFGGSADLTESNCTLADAMTIFTAHHPIGRYLHYGVREFGMSAMMNGMALYGGFIPYGGTFLTFADYARNAIRLAAIMQQRVIFVYSHDSIGLGEDGPTHQPVEQLPGLRLMPNLSVWRPCDGVETAVAWRLALERKGPTALLLSRQNLPYQKRTEEQVAFIERGAYCLVDFAQERRPDAILIATGSEVALAVLAGQRLADAKIYVRVVSMPSVDIFLSQDKTYQEQILPEEMEARVAIEAASSTYWYRFVGHTGAILGLDRFGASAPADDVFRDCGFSVEHVIEITKEVIHRRAASCVHQTKVKYASN